MSGGHSRGSQVASWSIVLVTALVTFLLLRQPKVAQTVRHQQPSPFESSEPQPRSSLQPLPTPVDTSSPPSEWRWRGYQCTNLDLFPVPLTHGCVPLTPRSLPHCHFDASLETITVPIPSGTTVALENETMALNDTHAPIVSHVERRCAYWASVNFTQPRDGSSPRREVTLAHKQAFSGIIDANVTSHSKLFLETGTDQLQSGQGLTLDEGLLKEDTETIVALLRRATRNGRAPLLVSGDSVTRQLFCRLVLIVRGARRASVNRVAEEAMFVSPFISTHNDWVYVLRRHNDETATVRNRDHFSPRGTRRKANKKTVVAYIPDVADAKPGQPRCNAHGQCVISPFDTVKSVWCDPDDALNPCLLKLIFVWEGFEHSMRLADDLVETLMVATTSAALPSSGMTTPCERLVVNFPAIHLHGQHYWSVLNINPPPYVPVPTRRPPLLLAASATIPLNVSNDTAVIEYAVSQLESWTTLTADSIPFVASEGSTTAHPECREKLTRAYRMFVLTTPTIRSQRKLFGITAREKEILRERLSQRNAALRLSLFRRNDSHMSLIDWDGITRTVPIDATPRGADEVHWMCSRLQEKLVEEGPGECRGGRDRAALALFLHAL